jgi:hypothetical protein
MKKLFLGTICLSLFAISLTLVQISCSKSTAQTSNTTTQINKILFIQFSGPSSVVFRICNYDGSGVQDLSIPLPTGYNLLTIHQPALSPDGSKLFFAALNNTTMIRSIFTCNINGTNLVKIVDADPGSQEIQLSGAY